MEESIPILFSNLNSSKEQRGKQLHSVLITGLFSVHAFAE